MKAQSRCDIAFRGIRVLVGAQASLVCCFAIGFKRGDDLCNYTNVNKTTRHNRISQKVSSFLIFVFLYK